MSQCRHNRFFAKDRIDLLTLKNCSEHNLKDIDLELPHDCLVVLTGVSGSGKSSLAFDTIHAEGQRRYLETFSPYIRQFFERFNPAKVSDIAGLRPTLAIEQKVRVRNTRSTVGTLTHLNDLLKVLWANIAKPVCEYCYTDLEYWQPTKLAEHIEKVFLEKKRTDLIIGAPLRLTDHSLEFVKKLQAIGLERYYDLTRQEYVFADQMIESVKVPQDNLVIVLSRIRNHSDRQELVDAIAQSFRFGESRLCVLEQVATRTILGGIRYIPHIFTEVPQCYNGGNPQTDNKIDQHKFEKPRPALFNFNHPLGACKVCKGFGHELAVDYNLCIPDASLSIEQGCIVCWSTPGTSQERKDLMEFCHKHEIPVSVPWSSLNEEQKFAIIYSKDKNYWGLEAWFNYLETKKYKLHIRVLLSRYRRQSLCRACEGQRLQPDALAYKCRNKTLPDLWRMSIGDLIVWLEETQSVLLNSVLLARPITELMRDILSRLNYLKDLGLEYLALDRRASTLSGGETQRVNLANALGGSLCSTHFILDEPSVGLHRKDIKNLIASVRKLQAKGNSILMVEHDPFLQKESDHIVELGPGAGSRGGNVVYDGDSENYYQHIGLIDNAIADRVSFKDSLTISNATANNVVALNLEIPLRSLVCLTGVSGSGKSTLMRSIIYDGIINETGIVKIPSFIKNVVLVDQEPPARNLRANIATYTGVWDVLRKVFASSEDAISRKIKASYFSFNVVGGRCDACKGVGTFAEDMQFLGDVKVVCDVCSGNRYKPKVLEIIYRGRNVAHWLQTTVDEAYELLGDISAIECKLGLLREVGLGHLALGHSLADLSGGEAQRLKLVSVLEGREGHSNLLLLDEPTLGLEVRDVERLITLLQTLKGRGCSVICIAHHCALMMKADWLIDLGPEGGIGGGLIVEQGHPWEVEQRARTHTARSMREYRCLVDRSREVKSYTDVKSVDEVAMCASALLTIKGAREHNLKNIDVSIPLGKMIGIVGVSGSGKSTIARDIIHAESQHQFLSVLSPYARQFINTFSRPDIDAVSGLQPTVFVGQHLFQPSKMSTVGTISEVNNYLRLLFAKIGQQFCPVHKHQKVGGGSVASVIEHINNLDGSQLVRVLAPIIKKKKGVHRDVFQRAIELGIDEVKCNGRFGTPGSFIDELARHEAHSIDFVVLKGRPQRIDSTLMDEAVTLGLSLGEGDICVDVNNGQRVDYFSVKRSCPECKRGFPRLDPEDFSFSSRRGRCKKCDGVGLNKFGQVCKDCHGARLHEIARSVKVANKDIAELCALQPVQLLEFFNGLVENIGTYNDSRHGEIIKTVVKAVVARLKTLVSLGLGYLSLSRPGETLSGGELQRLRLAAAIASPLTGVMYIMDEPSVGLHPIDTELVMEQLKILCANGNSVVMVEHDVDCINKCEHIVEIGPGGGRNGGELVFNGLYKNFVTEQSTITSRLISSNREELVSLRDNNFDRYLKIEDASYNNLHNVSVSIPLGALVVVAGRSGAGKSSLVDGVLLGLLTTGKKKPVEEGRIAYEGANGRLMIDDEIDRIVCVDQRPIGTNSRSTPVSFLGIWDYIRRTMAETVQAKMRGWGASYFSYNTGDGKCSECGGQGEIQLEMNFLPDARIECSVCRGARYHDGVGDVKYLGKSIVDILNMTFDEARTFFINHRKVASVIGSVCDLGLGYLRLGQSAPSLSGGESQRLKLALEIGKGKLGKVLYLLDEPTVGLHLADVNLLISALRRLVDAGATVVVIEHDASVVFASDYLVELGPHAGSEGGQVVFAGMIKHLQVAQTPWGDIWREKECFSYSKAQ
jgi:excinuclease ABC subunit A